MKPNRKQTTFEVEEELQFHIEMLQGNYTRHGMSAAEAKTAAARRFGNFERVKRQCVDIRRRNSLLRRVLKTSTILIALIGLSIHFLASNYKVERIGNTLIMIAIAGRLLIYVRGLGPSSFLRSNATSVITGTPDDV
jgi:hypothetical protein